MQWQTFLVLFLCVSVLPKADALCYYLTDSEGNQFSSIYPPYDLSYPREAPLTRTDAERLHRSGHLIITPNLIGCSKEPFPSSLFAAPPPPPSATVATVNHSPQPAPAPSYSPSPAPPATPPESSPPVAAAEEIPALPLSPPTTPDAMNESQVLKALEAMDTALSRKDLATYETYLADPLQITQTSANAPARLKTQPRVEYIADLQKQLQRVSSYKIIHKEAQITLDTANNSAKVVSKVSFSGVSKNNLPINREFIETAKFMWDANAQQAVLQELDMQQDVLEEASVEPMAASAAPPDTSTDCQAVKSLPTAECEALVQLYQSTGGAQWKKPNNWLSGSDPCQWRGVACNQQHVTELKLIRQDLRGPLPDLSALAQLQDLQLAKNKLTGSLPGLSHLTQLKKLDLSRNQFSGTLPDLSQLTQLEHFEADNNQFSGALPDFSKLRKLKVLALNNNELTGSITTLTSLDGLLEVRLQKNQLSGSLADLGGLKQIRKLYLSDNQFSGELPDLSGLRWLENCVLSDNQLSGALPASLNQLTDLEWLQFEHNQFSGKIPDFSNLKRLKIFHATGNRLCGEVPAWLLESNLKRDTSSLKLSNNQLVASTPEMQKFLEHKEPGWASSQTASPANCP